MKGVSCVGLFCEDIREEKSGAFTLIGIMPDNINTEVVKVAASGEARPAPHVTMLNKLCIYVRMNFDPDIDLAEGYLNLVPSSGDVIHIGNIGTALITQARTEAKDRGNPMAGVVLRAELGGYPIPEEGSLKLEMVFPSETLLAGALNFKRKVVPPTSSSETPQPS
jgi:hypothetical protein